MLSKRKTIVENKKNNKKNVITAKMNKQGKMIFVCLAWLAVWEVASLLVDSDLLLPGPIAAAMALVGMLGERAFYLNVLATLLRVVISMAVSFAAGMLLAWAAYRRDAVRVALAPVISFLKSVPVMAIIIYVILVASSDWVAIIVCVFMCLPIVYTNVLGGLDTVSREHLELADVYGLSSKQMIRLVYIPEIRPSINSALSLVCGISWKAVIAAEVLSIPQFSLGYPMLNAKYYLETPELVAYIVVIVAVSMGFERVVKAAFVKSPRMGVGACAHVGIGQSVEAVQAGDGMKCPPTIELSHVYKSYGDKSVLDDFSLRLVPGVTALVGPSGRGKTTVVRLVLGLTAADGGVCEVRRGADAALRVESGGGEPCEVGFSGSEGPCKGLAGRPVATLFQEDRLLPHLSVYDNIALSGAGEGELREMARKLEIEQVLEEYPEALSGGMKHRVAMARAFLCRSGLLILDEPLRGLDDELRDRILTRLWEQVTDDRTVLLISHDIDLCKKLSERIIYI